MYIEKLSLKNFRNFDKISISFSDNINIFYGDNAQGKTNLLESIYLCSTGRSQRTRNDKEMILFGENEAHIQIYAKKEKRTDRIDINLKRDGKKGIAVNNTAIKKLGELFGIVKTIIFSPEDLQMIKSGPSERRRFMDIELCQISNLYYYNLQQYYKILKQRNNLLKTIQKDYKLKETIFAWNEQLVIYGKKIISLRREFIKKINYIAFNIHQKITGGKEKLNIIYRPSVLEENFFSKLEKNIDKDLLYGTTSLGPHKDDLIFNINDIDIRNFGSQGQQRTASLSTKLAEIEFIKEESSSFPILLLDDVFSELDIKRQNFLIDNIKNIQTFITCTGIEDTIKKLTDKAFIYHVENGIVTVENEKFMV